MHRAGMVCKNIRGKTLFGSGSSGLGIVDFHDVL